ncbi:hypothetical protein E2I00_020076, partial [Balaenoptera physalus]
DNMFKRMAEFGLDSGRRVKGVTIFKPIVYGNVAQYFGKKRRGWAHPSMESICKTIYSIEMRICQHICFNQTPMQCWEKKSVVSEFYDEMMFQDPTAIMHQLLTSCQFTLGAYKHETEFAELELKERLKASRDTINCLKNEIKKLEEDVLTKVI